MSSAGQFPARVSPLDAAYWAAAVAVRPLQALIVAPSLVFLFTLTVMLFRPPGVDFYSLDRIAFGLLVFAVLLRVLVQRQPLRVDGQVTWPMLGLLILAFAGLVTQPYDVQNWSVFAAKWVVPFTLYHLAGFIFDDDQSLRRFETFCLVVLAYVSFTAIAFLFDARALVFPRFILDESLGIHADRARGPFLQAVANGVTLNLLGLMALDSFRRRRMRGVLALLLLMALPLAILATKTRAVWLSFAASLLLLRFLSPSVRLRRACTGLVLAGLGGLLISLSFADGDGSLGTRLEERSPVDYRVAVYHAGWEMFQEKPLWGWNAEQIQPELLKRMDGFHPEAVFLHNTYLEIAVQHGLLGLGLYLWIIVDLFRLGRKRFASAVVRNCGFPDEQFRSLWPLLVLVYLVNASFVVMNYQFVNGLLFTLAGVLAAQNRQSEAQTDVAT